MICSLAYRHSGWLSWHILRTNQADKCMFGSDRLGSFRQVVLYS